ncbi:MAG: carbohydrate ABC transporter permease [Spirochaetaceae bacterium]|nr:MAG: carbohydrate ABC transporter permease [Spirochaetaceae bacterium]
MTRSNEFSASAKALIYGTLCLWGFICLYPFAIAIAGSFTAETQLRDSISVIPRQPSLDAYRLLFARPERILNAYRVTIFVTVVGTVLSVLINAMMAYAISRPSCRYRYVLGFYAYFTLLFSGGMVAWFIVMVNILGLRNNVWAMIVPYLSNAWFLLILRSYFRSVPNDFAESAKMDGAREMRIFLQIFLPLSIPAIATIGLFTAMRYWNDWWLGIMLIDDVSLQPLQLMLRSVMSRVQFLAGDMGRHASDLGITLPTRGLRFATTIVTIGPIIFLYPFLQKYFIKGLTIGGIKG